jgi:hypothetical protein
MLSRSLVATALALAVVAMVGNIGAANAAPHDRATTAASSHHSSKAPYQETGEIPFSAIG